MEEQTAISGGLKKTREFGGNSDRDDDKSRANSGWEVVEEAADDVTENVGARCLARATLGSCPRNKMTKR